MFEAGEETGCIKEGEIGRIPKRRKGGYSHIGTVVLSEYCILWSSGTKINSRGHFDVIAESVDHGTGSTKHRVNK